MQVQMWHQQLACTVRSQLVTLRSPTERPYLTEGSRRRICHAAEHRWNCTISSWLLRTRAKEREVNACERRRSQRSSTQGKSMLMKPWDRHNPDSCDIGQIPVMCMLTQNGCWPKHISRFSPNHVERSQGSKLYAKMCSAATNFDLANLS